MRRGWSVFVAASLVILPARAVAHEIPPSVTVLAFVKPEANRLRVLLRVPLEAMRDVDFPLRGPGYLNIQRATPLLRDAARVWLAGYLSLYEGDARLGNATVAVARVSL